MHTVKVNSAIVRETPEKKGKVVEKLAIGAEIMEMEVQGEWYEIYVASTDLSGWMHISTLGLLGGGGAVAAPAEKTSKKAAAKPKPQKIQISSAEASPELKEFQKYLLKYNARTFVLKGYTPVLNAGDDGNGKLSITVTEAWLNKPNARKKSTMIILYTRWKKQNNLGESQVIAVDGEGNEIMRYPQ